MFDFLIIGQGVAGSMLAWHLSNAGKKVCVIDNAEQNASTAASGIINPITGKRFLKSWLIDELQDYAINCYQKIEAQLHVAFLKTPILFHILNSIEEINDWSAKSATKGYEKFLSNNEIKFLPKEKVINPHGYFEVQGVMKVEPEIFLHAIKKWLISNHAFVQDTFNEDDIIQHPNFIEYKNLKSKYVIFATGYKAQNSKHLEVVKFSPVKGEGLFVEIENFFNENVVHGDVMIAPTNHPNTYYIGSTYEWKFDNHLPTTTKKNELIARTQKTINCNFTVLNHVAGIRPASHNRRPILGFLPNSRIGIFNGMGTKGYSLAPYFAKHFCDHLTEGKNLFPEVDVKRFF